MVKLTIIMIISIKPMLYILIKRHGALFDISVETFIFVRINSMAA